MMPVRPKAIAYITQQTRLLVFRHLDAPEAGLQAPAGSIRAGEDPADAALREAQEETGLRHLRLAGLLGITRRDMRPWGIAEIHERHFYHLRCQEATPERWLSCEADPSDGSPGPIRLECSWVDLRGRLPELSGWQAEQLPLLLAQLAASGELAAPEASR
jgi:8-oxo-dGTP pyrophosphatase MutT (NUDIX family)